jgi:hypothetical protein
MKGLPRNVPPPSAMLAKASMGVVAGGSLLRSSAGQRVEVFVLAKPAKRALVDASHDAGDVRLLRRLRLVEERRKI